MRIREKTTQLKIISFKDNRLVVRQVVVIGFCLFLSFMLLLLGTKSSPLYPFNDWVDANSSFTMGKAMMNGRVLYRDIFDHRGPLFYFLYGLGYLVSNTSFLGVFLIEVVSFSLFLYFSYLLIRLFLDENYALIALPLIAGTVVNMSSFAHGGSTEEFCLPFLALSLFFLIKYFKEVHPLPMSQSWLFINGIIAGCILWMKFSMLGFWIGWAGSVLIGMLINKYTRQAFLGGIVFLSGMVTATIPWMIYFGVNGSIYEWLFTYIFLNLSGFTEALSEFDRIIFIVIIMVNQFAFNPLTVGLMSIGLYVFVVKKKFLENRFARLSLLSCVVLMLISVFGGGRSQIYYFLIFAPFVIFGFIALINLHYEEFGSFRSGTVLINTLLLSFITVFSYTYQANQNTYMRNIDQEDLVQYKYAEIINETDHPTLLNYGWLDGGFFTTAEIIPNIKYFHKPHFSYEKLPIMMDEQRRYIKEQIVDYVVIPIPVDIYDESIEIPYLDKDYDLIADETQEFENIDFYYLLYRVKESINYDN